MKDDSGKLMKATLSPLAHDLGCRILELALALDGKVVDCLDANAVIYSRLLLL